MSETTAPPSTTLRRTLTLPLLVFYGLGVTIGAGIFALVGEVLALAGDRAPQSFLLAAVIAGATGLSYAILVRLYPRAGGEAIFVNRGLGRTAGFLSGFGVVLTAIISSAVITLAFAGYAASFLPLPEPVLAVGILAILAAIACWGVRESVIFAAVITVLELATLVLVAAFGLPEFVSLSTTAAAFTPPDSLATLNPVLAGAILAFFAFIGFEDIENMAEETQNPARTAPRAILWTLGLTAIVYLSVSLVAASVPQRELIANSQAPMAVLFELATGYPGDAVAVMASIAMVNGILVQIVMAARVLYGMAGEGQMPAFLGQVHARRRTPVVATLLTTAVILLLAMTFPLVALAEITSLVTLAVFAMVNLSLFAIGRKSTDPLAARFHWWGIPAAALCLAILLWNLSAMM